MELIYFLEKELSVYYEDNSIFILAPLSGKGEHYNIEQLLYSFMKECKYPITRGKEIKEKKTKKKVFLNIGNPKYYEKYLTELISRQVSHINEETKGLYVNDKHMKNLINNDWKIKEEINKEENITGNLDYKILHMIIDINSGSKCKVYFLPKDTKKNKRIIYNANIFFNNLLAFVEKKYHIVIINENLQGGIIYMHNKHARPNDNYYHKKYIITSIKELLKNRFNEYYEVTETYDITENFEGGYTKCPIKITK
ncbi:MAG: hypothetical protein ACK5HR_04585 [Mycoplasmatales bacterium]